MTPASPPVVAAPTLAPAGRLMGSRVRMVFNAAFKQSRGRRGWTTVLLIFLITGMIASFRVAGVVFSLTLPGDAVFMRVVAGGLGMLTGFTAVTSITFALGSLYFARDLDLLHAAPLRVRVIILSRIGTQLGLGIALGAVIAGPPLLAYTFAVHAPLALPLAVITIIALVTIPLAFGSALTIIALRAVPARFVRDAGGLVVTVAVFVVAAVNLALRGPSGFTGKPTGLPLDSIGTGPVSSAWSPVGWAARAITAAVHGDIVTWAGWSLPLIAAAMILPVVVAFGCEDAYLTGYLRSAQASRRTRGGERARRASRSRRRVPVWAVIALKDLREVRRDPSQMGQLLLPMVLFGLYLGTPGQSAPGGVGDAPAWYLIGLNATFASLLFAANIALRGVGMEGQRLWLLRTSPLGSREILVAKYVSGFLIAVIPASLLFWIGEVRAGTGPVALLLPTVGVWVIVAGVTALAAGIGAARPRLDWTDPRRAVGIGTTLGYLLTGAVYLAVCFIILGLPFALGGAATGAVVEADVALVVWTVIAGGVALVAGARSLARIEA